ncbi:MAG: hypothetical protein PHV95_06000 [Eubacteriales bacterium]|nr:hypothetical protein [Eubacteriales bacterium]
MNSFLDQLADVPIIVPIIGTTNGSDFISTSKTVSSLSVDVPPAAVTATVPTTS